MAELSQIDSGPDRALVPAGSRPLRCAAHEVFAREHAGGLSLRAAWVTAGYPETSRNWSHLAAKPTVAARIEWLRKEYQESAAISLRYLQEKLLGIASVDATDFFEVRPLSNALRLKDVKSLPSHMRAAVSEMVVDRNGRVGIKLESKTTAITTLLKTMPGALTPDVSVTATAVASAEAKTHDMSAAELSRRLSWAIHQALEREGKLAGDDEPIDVSPAPLFDQAQPAAEPAALPPPRQRAQTAVLSVVNLARELRGDRETLEFLHGVMTKATAAIAELAHAY